MLDDLSKSSLTIVPKTSYNKNYSISE